MDACTSLHDSAGRSDGRVDRLDASVYGTPSMVWLTPRVRPRICEREPLTRVYPDPRRVHCRLNSPRDAFGLVRRGVLLDACVECGEWVSLRLHSHIFFFFVVGEVAGCMDGTSGDGRTRTCESEAMSVVG